MDRHGDQYKITIWRLISQISGGSFSVHSFFFAGFMEVSFGNHPQFQIRTHLQKPHSFLTKWPDSVLSLLQTKMDQHHTICPAQGLTQEILCRPPPLLPRSLAPIMLHKKNLFEKPQLPTKFVSFNNAEEDFNFTLQFSFSNSGFGNQTRTWQK